MRKLFILFITLIASVSANAQIPELGVFGGGSYYIGDLNPYGHFQQMKYSAGIVYRQNLANERIAIRINGMYGKVSGSDDKSSNSSQVNRNLNFSSSIIEVGPIIEINFFNYEVGSLSLKKNKFQTPYMFIGLTYFRMNPVGVYDGEKIELQPLATEGQETSQNSSQKMYKLNQISIPLGIGYKFNITSRFAMSFEYGIRKTFTDYLDDVSGKYPDTQLLAAEAGELSAQMSDQSLNSEGITNLNSGTARGNSKNKDWYSFFGAIISFRLQKYSTCKNQFKKPSRH